MVLMESLKDFETPRLVAVVEEQGKDGNNLIVVTELYAERTAFGESQDRNHVLITVYEKTGLPEYVKSTLEKGRVLHIKEGLSTDTQASLQLAGGISEEVLSRNVARFNKKVKAFKEKNKIFYAIGEETFLSTDMPKTGASNIYGKDIVLEDGQTDAKALIDEYGAIPPGENPNQDASVPKKTAADEDVAQTLRTVLEAKTTPDAIVPTLEEMTANGEFSFTKYTDDQAMQTKQIYNKKDGICRPFCYAKYISFLLWLRFR